MEVCLFLNDINWGKTIVKRCCIPKQTAWTKKTWWKRQESKRQRQWRPTENPLKPQQCKMEPLAKTRHQKSLQEMWWDSKRRKSRRTFQTFAAVSLLPAWTESSRFCLSVMVLSSCSLACRNITCSFFTWKTEVGLMPGNTPTLWRRHRCWPDLVSQPLVLEWPEVASHSLSTCHSVGRASCLHFSPGDEFKIK